MSTRCNIGVYASKESGFKEWKALIYKCCDGYPDGVIPDIEPMLRRFSKERGLSDTEYVAAGLLHELNAKGIEENININKDFGLPGHTIDGKDWLICKDVHMDIDYFYKIYPSAIEVYSANMPWEGEIDAYDKDNFTLENTIELS